MMYCDRCGKKVKDGTRFCGHCGADLFDDRTVLADPELSGDPILPDERTVYADPGFPEDRTMNAEQDLPEDRTMFADPAPEPKKRKGKGSAILAALLGVCLFAGGFFAGRAFPASGAAGSPQSAESEAAVLLPADMKDADGQFRKVFRDGHSYRVYDLDEVKSWAEAKSYCEKQGGHLATVSSQEENDFLFAYIRQCGFNAAYFGFSDSEKEGEWKWVTDEDITFTNWYPEEPNNTSGGEDEAAFYFIEASGRWFDGNMGVSNGGEAFLCEWEDTAAETEGAAAAEEAEEQTAEEAAQTEAVAFLGKPLSELFQTFGRDYQVHDSEGGVQLYYEASRLSFAIAGTEIRDDAVITMIESYGGTYPIYAGLRGSMNYTEMKKSMEQSGVTIPEPVFEHDMLSDQDVYSTSFQDAQKQYLFAANWNQAPESNAPSRFFVKLA